MTAIELSELITHALFLLITAVVIVASVALPLEAAGVVHERAVGPVATRA